MLYAMENLGRNRSIENSHLSYSCAASLSPDVLKRLRSLETLVNVFKWTKRASRQTEVFISFLLTPWGANARVV
jgi:hypothetical protein